MTTYVYRPDHPLADDLGMVDRTIAGPRHDADDAPQVISDIMEPTRHMADGRYYTSKAKFREITRAHGCVEVGNETATVLKPRRTVELSKQQRVDDMRRAIAELRQR